jgi:hypothetical protein
MWQGAATAGIAAAIAVLKGWIASRVTDTITPSSLAKAA